MQRRRVNACVLLIVLEGINLLGGRLAYCKGTTPRSETIDSKSGRVGSMAVGDSVDKLLQSIADLVLRDLQLEGTFSPALIQMRGRGEERIFEIRMDVDRRWVISRIDVLDQHYKTNRDLHVGSSVDEVRSKCKQCVLTEGEGAKFLVDRPSRISFQFAADGDKVIAILVI